MDIEWLRRARQLSPQVRNFVNGRRQPESDGHLIEKLSPRNGQLMTSFRAATAQNVDDAVENARRSFYDGRWSKLPIQRRKDVLHQLASLIEKHREELALLDCLEVGKPITDTLSFDVPTAAGCIRYNAEAADKSLGPVYGVDSSSLSYQLRRPLGVVAGIIGWNFPLLLAAGKIGPALAMGNSLVLKPSELTTLSSIRLAELAVEAGVPEGVFNVIHGDSTVGAALALHRDVDLVTFTGSSHTGKKLLVAAGQSNMKRLVLECGGKAPNIVFDDSPSFEAIAEATIARSFWNQGQVCTASSRLLIQEDVKDELLPLIIRKAGALAPGDPLDPKTTFGALVSREHQQKVRDYIVSGTNEGAHVLHESTAAAPNAGGYYLPPVIFDAVSPNQRIAQEEIFGPVLAIITFRDEEDAIKIANNTIFGLSAVLWTRDLGRAHRVSQGVNAGWIIVNASEKPAGGPGTGVLSVGGHKESGIGTEGGLEGLESYISKTAVQLFV